MSEPKRPGIELYTPGTLYTTAAREVVDLDGFRQSLVNTFKDISPGTYFIDNDTDSLARRLRSSDEHISRFRELMIKSIPLVDPEVFRSVTVAYLRWIVQEFYKGKTLDLVLRAEETRALENYSESVVVAMFFGGDIFVPREVLCHILSFLEYSYELVVNIGLVDYSWYAAVLSSWKKVVIRKRNLYRVSELAMRACADLTLKDRLSRDSWKYVWALGCRKGAKGIRELERFDFGGNLASARVKDWIEKYVDLLGSLREFLEEREEAQPDDSEASLKFRRVTEVCFPRILGSNVYQDGSSDALTQYSEPLGSLQTVFPNLTSVHYPPVLTLLDGLVELRELKVHVRGTAPTFFRSLGAHVAPHSIAKLVLGDLGKLEQRPDYQALSTALARIVPEEGPTWLELTERDTDRYRSHQWETAWIQISFPVSNLRTLVVDSHSLLKVFMGLELTNLEVLMVRGHPRYNQADPLVSDLLRKLPSLSHLKELLVGYWKQKGADGRGGNLDERCAAAYVKLLHEGHSLTPSRICIQHCTSTVKKGIKAWVEKKCLHVLLNSPEAFQRETYRYNTPTALLLGSEISKVGDFLESLPSVRVESSEGELTKASVESFLVPEKTPGFEWVNEADEVANAVWVLSRKSE